MVLAPAILLPLVLAGQGRIGPRRAAALSGLAVLCCGGVNATATILAAVPAGLWLVTRARWWRSPSTWWWSAAVARRERVVARAPRRAGPLVTTLPRLDRAQCRRRARDRPPRRGPRDDSLAGVRRHLGRRVVAGRVRHRHRAAARRRDRPGRRGIAGRPRSARPTGTPVPAPDPGPRGAPAGSRARRARCPPRSLPRPRHCSTARSWPSATSTRPTRSSACPSRWPSPMPSHRAARAARRAPVRPAGPGWALPSGWSSSSRCRRACPGRSPHGAPSPTWPASGARRGHGSSDRAGDGRALVVPASSFGEYDWGRTIDEPIRPLSERRLRGAGCRAAHPRRHDQGARRRGATAPDRTRRGAGRSTCCGGSGCATWCCATTSTRHPPASRR